MNKCSINFLNHIKVTTTTQCSAVNIAYMSEVRTDIHLDVFKQR